MCCDVMDFKGLIASGSNTVLNRSSLCEKAAQCPLKVFPPVSEIVCAVRPLLREELTSFQPPESSIYLRQLGELLSIANAVASEDGTCQPNRIVLFKISTSFRTFNVVSNPFCSEVARLKEARWCQTSRRRRQSLGFSFRRG